MEAEDSSDCNAAVTDSFLVISVGILNNVLFTFRAPAAILAFADLTFECAKNGSVSRHVNSDGLTGDHRRHGCPGNLSSLYILFICYWEKWKQMGQWSGKLFQTNTHRSLVKGSS